VQQVSGGSRPQPAVMAPDLATLRRAAEAEMARPAPDRPEGPPAKRRRRAGALAERAFDLCSAPSAALLPACYAVHETGPLSARCMAPARPQLAASGFRV
jgi:hypothetical protein